MLLTNIDIGLGWGECTVDRVFLGSSFYSFTYLNGRITSIRIFKIQLGGEFVNHFHDFIGGMRCEEDRWCRFRIATVNNVQDLLGQWIFVGPCDNECGFAAMGGTVGVFQ